MAYKAITDRPKRRLALASDPHYWVEIHTTLTYGERKMLSDKTLAPMELGDAALKTLICDWNIDDESGTIIPISAEAIEKLDEDDAAVIAEAIIDVVNPSSEKVAAANKEKKSSSEESTPSSLAEEPRA